MLADQPEGDWKVILPRVNDVEYSVKHRGDHFFIEIRDKDRPNSEVLVAPVADPTHTKASAHSTASSCSTAVGHEPPLLEPATMSLPEFSCPLAACNAVMHLGLLLRQD